MMEAATPAQDGLTASAAASRLVSEGPNELPAPDRRNVLRILIEVVRQPMILLLLAGGTVYLLLGSRVEALLLLVFACLSVSITIVQEARSEHVLDALRNLASPRATVMRDGVRVVIAGREVVRDDLMWFSEGDRVAADANLLSAQDLLVDESLLTGESVPVPKAAMAKTAPGTDAAAGDAAHRIFAGTLVVRGSGTARVSATGPHSEMGKIGHALGAIETSQPHLQKQIQRLVRSFAIGGAIAGGLTVILFGLLRGSWLEAMLGGIALGMSMLPEEFPLVMAVFMAMGAWRISQARVLTRRAAAIETLGATTVLCTDKTGTLTENRMTVAVLAAGTDIWERDKPAPLAPAGQLVLRSARLASALVPTDPMDIAVHRLAGDLKEPATQGAPLHVYGLRPDLFAVVNVWAAAGGGATAHAKGAVEAIADLCKLAPDRLQAIRQQADALAHAGIRVLGVAEANNVPAGEGQALPTSPRELTFTYLGLIGFADPLRANVPAAVAECHTAGIRVVMITGDYPATASAIGKQAGLPDGTVVTGDMIAAMSDQELAEAVKTTTIFARIRPEQKLRIVESLKANGEVVAMTGDGVNDAPAIKAAHIGIAMGGRGTDVAREASAIVLLDDDFGSIVKTIRLGRRIYDNLRKAVEYIVAVHIPIAGLALVPLLLGLPLIVTPILIAFLEMVIDPACSIVLEAEGEEDDVMRRPPRDSQSALLLPRRLTWALLQGGMVLTIITVLLIFANRAGMPEPDLRALVFTALVLANMGLILINRSFSASLVRAFLKPNRSLWILMGGVSVVLVASLAWPPMRLLFHFGTLHVSDLMPAVAAGLISLLTLEVIKSRWFRSNAGG